MSHNLMDDLVYPLGDMTPITGARWYVEKTPQHTGESSMVWLTKTRGEKKMANTIEELDARFYLKSQGDVVALHMTNEYGYLVPVRPQGWDVVLSILGVERGDEVRVVLIREPAPKKEKKDEG